MVFIATPCFGGLVSQHYMQSVVRLIQFASQANFDAALALLGMILHYPQPQHAGKSIFEHAEGNASLVHRCR